MLIDQGFLHGSKSVFLLFSLTLFVPAFVSCTSGLSCTNSFSLHQKALSATGLQVTWHSYASTEKGRKWRDKLGKKGKRETGSEGNPTSHHTGELNFELESVAPPEPNTTEMN
jgi:hypothetical protein